MKASPLVGCVARLEASFRASAISLSTVLLAYLLGVVASSLVGGIAPAVATALLAGVAANFFFVPPVRTLTIAQPESAFALLVFVIVGAVIATIVDRSAARAEDAALRRAEANVLLSLSTGVLGRGNGVQALLDQACTTFGMRSAALFEDTSAGRAPAGFSSLDKDLRRARVGPSAQKRPRSIRQSFPGRRPTARQGRRSFHPPGPMQYVRLFSC